MCVYGRDGCSNKVEVSAEGARSRGELVLLGAKGERVCCVCCSSGTAAVPLYVRFWYQSTNTDAEGAGRYSVVPHTYRRHLPEFLKSRSSHDIVLLCVKCHQLASFHGDSLRARLAVECSAPIGVGRPAQEDALRKRARSLASALLSARATDIPPARRREMLETIRSFLRQEQAEKVRGGEGGGDEHVGSGEVERETLVRISCLPVCHQDENEDDASPLSHASLVVASQIDLAAFIRRWRQTFLESMNPQHLPMGWSVENPLPSDQQEAGHGLAQDLLQQNMADGTMNFQ